MADLVKELNNLDFSNYIGGPLQAAVEAQNAASLAEVNFIKTVGFKTVPVDGTIPAHEELVYVDFHYKKMIPNPLLTESTSDEPDSDEPTPVNVEQLYTLSVPLLSIVTIPCIRIEEITIDFSAKLNSCDTKAVGTEIGANVELGLKSKIVNFKASASYKRKSTSNSTVERAYDLSVHVRAVNDEIPAGLDRVLRILENEIRDTKVDTQP